MKQCLLIISGLFIFLYYSSTSSASTIYSNDFKTSLGNYTQTFGFCSTSPTGLSNCTADLAYNPLLLGIMCVSADFTNPSSVNSGLGLTSSHFDAGSTFRLNYNGFFAMDYNVFFQSNVPFLTGTHNYMLCHDGNSYIGYADGNEVMRHTFSSQPNDVDGFYIAVNNNDVTNLVATDSLPITPTPTPTPTPQPQLSVQVLKQTDPQWTHLTYDLATIWSPTNSIIDTWGCALTSAAMVLNYYNIHNLPGTPVLPLNPGNLDAWLGLQPDGYIPNGNVNWLALQRLTKQAKANNPTFPFDALEYNRINSSDTATLLADLSHNQPDILEEPGHFVVATGQSGSTYTINDPYYPKTLLSDYGNTFTSLGRYIPSFTDLSYILFTSDPSLTLTLKDGNTPVGQSYTQQPLSGAGTALTAGNPINLLYLQKPTSGNYTLTISGVTNQTYSIKGFLYDTNGNVKPFTQTGVIDSQSPNAVTIAFDPTNLNKDITTKVVSFDSFLSDINNLYKLKNIKIFPYELLKSLAASLKKTSTLHNKTAARVELGIIASILKQEKGKGLSNTAYQILSEDVVYLQNHL